MANNRLDNGGEGGRLYKKQLDDAIRAEGKRQREAKEPVVKPDPLHTTTQLYMQRKEEMALKRMSRYEKKKKAFFDRQDRIRKALEKKKEQMAAETPVEVATTLDVEAKPA
jgi:hypothetical protein